MKQEIFLSASCFLAEFFLLKHTLKETEVATYFLNKIADLNNFLLASLVKNRLQPSESHSLDHAEFGDFTLLFCKCTKSYNTHAQPCADWLSY